MILAAIAGRLRERVGPRFLRAVNIASGLSILGFAGWQIAQLGRWML
jgi:hypothetical protein